MGGQHYSANQRCVESLPVRNSDLIGRVHEKELAKERDECGAREGSGDRLVVRVLPLFVGSDFEIERMREQLSLQRDKLHMRWDGNPQSVTSRKNSCICCHEPA